MGGTGGKDRGRGSKRRTEGGAARGGQREGQQEEDRGRGSKRRTEGGAARGGQREGQQEEDRGRGSISSTPTDIPSANSFLPIVVNGNVLHLRGVREEVDNSIQQRLHSLVLEGRAHQDWGEAATDGGSPNSSLPRVT